jgi:hypothetical protein
MLIREVIDQRGRESGTYLLPLKGRLLVSPTVVTGILYRGMGWITVISGIGVRIYSKARM